MTTVNQLNQDLSRPLDPSASQQEARDKLKGVLHINQHGIKFTPWGTLLFSIRKIVRKKNGQPKTSRDAHWLPSAHPSGS